ETGVGFRTAKRGVLMRSQSIVSVCRRLVYMFSISLTVFAQTDRGSLTGTIIDPAGAVVPIAKVDVKNVDTGVVFNGGPSAPGNYVIQGLAPGNYELTVTVQGFKKYVRQNLVMTAGAIVRQDVNLEVGATSETVTVTDAAPLLKTETSEVSHNVSIARA